jgi:ankyrin repeat protein
MSWTALMSASEKGHAEIVKILIEAGASRNITKEKV